jgi:hypothetical protein
MGKMATMDKLRCRLFQLQELKMRLTWEIQEMETQRELDFISLGQREKEHQRKVVKLHAVYQALDATRCELNRHGMTSPY